MSLLDNIINKIKDSYNDLARTANVNNDINLPSSEDSNEVQNQQEPQNNPNSNPDSFWNKLSEKADPNDATVKFPNLAKPTKEYLDPVDSEKADPNDTTVKLFDTTKRYDEEYLEPVDVWKADPNDTTGTFLDPSLLNPFSDEYAEIQKRYEEDYASRGYDSEDSSTWTNEHKDKSLSDIGDDLIAGKYGKSMIDQDQGSQDIPYNDDVYYTDWWKAMSDAVGLNKEVMKDDGTLNPNALSSDTMTGEEYERLAILSGTGRPIEKIDPNGTYSKIQEMQDYGFVPYVRSPEDLSKMKLQWMSEIPTKAANELGRSRTSIFDYTIDTGDQNFSGNDFENNVTTYIDRMGALEKATQTEDGKSIFTDKNGDHTGMTPYTYGAWQVTYEDGTVKEHPHGDYDALQRKDGTILVTFSDGSQALFDDENDFTTNLKGIGYQVAEEGEEPIAWFPDLVLDSGQRIPYADVVALVNDDVNSEDRDSSISYDYGFGDLGKPASHSKGLFFDGVPGLVNGTWDLLAQSAPYFTVPSGITLGLSRTASAINGREPKSLRADGTSRNLAEDVDDSEYLSLLLANAAMPLTEFGWGRIGKAAAAPFTKTLTKYGLDQRALYPWYQWLTGTVGEGLEELPGNVVEDMTQNGFRGTYANQVYDENGKAVYDSAGRPVLDRDTSFWDRLNNWKDDAGEAFAGGAWLGALFGIPSLPSTYVKSAENWANNRRLIADGTGFYRNGRRVERGTADDLYPVSEETDNYFDKIWNIDDQQ